MLQTAGLLVLPTLKNVKAFGNNLKLLWVSESFPSAATVKLI